MEEGVLHVVHFLNPQIGKELGIELFAAIADLDKSTIDESRRRQ